MPTVTTYLCASPCAEAIDFYIRAFGAVEVMRIPNPDGRLGHAEITIGDTPIMLSDEWPEGKVFSPLRYDGHTVSLSIEVPDADAAYHRAIACGATANRPPADEPYGRSSWVIDPFGHHWNILTPNRDFDPSKM
ncbi:MAG TPA: VOC family protein [Tepidiformaceae bacterium]|nr:VOC family protein [Tepidiformaceae bacterium]HMO94513.1 VOC family protein [Tepidiformaceae bacterium]